MTRRLATLDLLRGIAAIAVLCVHFPFATDGVALAPKGYLAVDLFFMLSGFVIAQAYGDRLRSRPWFWQFCVTRLIRLWPLYAFASLIGIAVTAAFAAAGQDPMKWVSSLILTALFLPTPAQLSVQPQSLYPFDFAAWSLFWELAVNIVYAAVAPRLSTRLLAIIVALGLAAIASICIAGYSVDGGANWRGAVFGVVRSSYGFFAGVALFRIQQRRRAPSLPSFIPACVLILALFLRPSSAFYDLACLAVVFPLLIWVSAEARSGRAALGPSLLLGYLSYPIYVLHSPLIELTTQARGGVSALSGVSLPAALLLYIVSILVIGWIVGRLFDTPVRAWLNRRLTPYKPAPSAETAP